MENDDLATTSSASFTNIEDVVRHVDKTGRWQYWLTARTGFVLIGISLLLYIQALFFVGKMEHKCIAYEISSTATLETNRSFPSNSTSSSTCRRSGRTDTDRCIKWTYSSPYFDSTMVSNYDLVCDRAYLIPTFQSSAFIGQIIGNAVSGITSDRYGRRLTLVIGYAGLLAVSLLMGFVQSVWWNIALRGLCGVFGTATWNAIFVLCMEVAVPERRHVVGVFSALSWPLGAAVASIIPLFVREWRQLCWITVVIAAVTGLPVALTLPESPRWLVIHQRFRRAHKVLSSISKNNPTEKLPADDEFLQDVYRRHAAEERQQGNHARSPARQIVRLLAERKLRVRSLTMAISWVLISFVFFGIIYYGANVIPGASPMLILGAMSISRAIAYPFYVVLFKSFGCRNTLRNVLPVIWILLLGLGLLPIPREQTGGAIGYATLYVVSHILSDVCFNALYIVTGELYPTVLRQTSLGFFSLLGRAGSFGSTFAASLLSQIWLPLPAIIFSTASAVTAVAVLALPRDTDEVALPDTVRDANLVEESLPMGKRTENQSEQNIN